MVCPPYQVSPSECDLLPPHTYRVLAGTVRHVWESEGLRGFYRGLGPTILGYLPTWAIYFTVYDAVKQRMSALRGESQVVSCKRGGREGKHDDVMFSFVLSVLRPLTNLPCGPLGVRRTL